MQHSKKTFWKRKKFIVIKKIVKISFFFLKAGYTTSPMMFQTHNQSKSLLL